MAASLVKNCVLGVGARKTLALRTGSVFQTWTRTAFFRRRKDKEADTASVQQIPEQDSQSPPSLTIATPQLRKREGLQIVRSYVPPADVESRVQRVVSLVCGERKDWKSLPLDNNRVKFKILEGVMRECDHLVPNSRLVDMASVADVIDFFSAPVRDTSSYDDLASLDLPPNLHIQLEPVRFDPETDTVHGGVSAFPGRPTVISSLKFRRKYGKTDTK